MLWIPRSGNFRLVRTNAKSLRLELADNTDNPAYIFTGPRVGYRKEKGETADGEQEERSRAAPSPWCLRQGISPMDNPSFQKPAPTACLRVE